MGYEPIFSLSESLYQNLDTPQSENFAPDDTPQTSGSGNLTNSKIKALVANVYGKVNPCWSQEQLVMSDLW